MLVFLHLVLVTLQLVFSKTIRIGDIEYNSWSTCTTMIKVRDGYMCMMKVNT